MEGKTAVVIGGGRGIGLGVRQACPYTASCGLSCNVLPEISCATLKRFSVQLCKALQKEGYDVVATCRAPTRELAEPGVTMVSGTGNVQRRYHILQRPQTNLKSGLY